MACLDAVADCFPERARFDAVCRLLCDANASWAVKLQALQCLNTLVIIGGSEEERLDLRALVGRALTALAVEFELPLDVGEEPGVARARLEETFQGTFVKVSVNNDGADKKKQDGGGDGAVGATTTTFKPLAEPPVGGWAFGCPPSRHRAFLLGLWRQLAELRGGGERGELALEACLAQSSTLPVLLHLRFLALRAAGSTTASGAGETGGGGDVDEDDDDGNNQGHNNSGGGGGDASADRVEGFAADALLFVEKLDLYEKTCVQDKIEVDLNLEKLAPSNDNGLEDDELGRAMVLDAKERVVARLTVMMQQLQREAVTMGPLVDSFATALLDMVIAAVNEELTDMAKTEENNAEEKAEAGRRLDDTLGGLLDGIVEEVGYDDTTDGGVSGMSTVKVQASQAMSLSDSPALMETVQRIRGLEQSMQRFEKQAIGAVGGGGAAAAAVGGGDRGGVRRGSVSQSVRASLSGEVGNSGGEDYDLDAIAAQRHPSMYKNSANHLAEGDESEEDNSSNNASRQQRTESMEKESLAKVAAIEEEFRLKVRRRQGGRVLIKGGGHVFNEAVRHSREAVDKTFFCPLLTHRFY
jgi:hypothetical protein